MDDTSRALKAWLTFGGCVLVVAVLYWAQAVLVPIAFAVLFTFVLTPPVTWLQRWIGRVPAVLSMVVLVFTILGLAGWGLARQMDLAGRRPAALPRQHPGEDRRRARRGQGRRGRAAAEDDRGHHDRPGEARTRPRERSPASGRDLGAGDGLLRFASWLGPILGPLSTAGLVVAMVVFMLLERRALRDRLIGVFGHGQLAVTTNAFDEAGTRVSRQLLMQSLVNLVYGVAVGVGLYVLDVPYHLVWAGLGAVLRFIPYVGPVLGAGAPILVSLAAADGWAGPLWVMGLFVVLELFTNLVLETVLYAGAAGVSQVALLVSVAFWTWLWGPLGLLMATPLTVCLVVLGKHVPGLEFVGTLMADTPALAPEYGYYQRLLARDQAEAADLIERHIRTESARSVYDALLLPALNYAERDRLEAAPVVRGRNGRHRRDARAAGGRGGVDPAPAARDRPLRPTIRCCPHASRCACSATRSMAPPMRSHSPCSRTWWTICRSPSTCTRRDSRPLNSSRSWTRGADRSSALRTCRRARLRRRATSSSGCARRCRTCVSWSGAGARRRWRTRARRDCGTRGPTSSRRR